MNGIGKGVSKKFEDSRKSLSCLTMFKDANIAKFNRGTNSYN